MGAWGPGILSNDIAADVAAQFRELIEDGLDADAATAQVIEEFEDAPDDEVEATGFWTGLAFAQFRLGRLQPSVRDRALALIAAGGDAHLGFTRDFERKRLAALERLRAQIEGPQRAPVKVRKPKIWPSPVAVGDIFLLRLHDGRQARFHVVGMDDNRYGQWPIVAMLDDEGREYVEPQRKSDRGAPQPIRWALGAGRKRDLPGPDDLTIVGHEKPAASSNARSYGSWDICKHDAQRILDDPDASVV